MPQLQTKTRTARRVGSLETNFQRKKETVSTPSLVPANSLIPEDSTALDLKVEGKTVRLTNLSKLFWPEAGITKGDLIRYYASVSSFLLPHIVSRAMVMKRYPNGAAGPFFFQKRAPVPRPEWIDICSIEHDSGNIIDFPIVRDLPTLLWLVNLGCIDLNPWYARCDDVHRPDYLHFDLDPVEGADFEKVLETARAVYQALKVLDMPCYAKTSGSKGIHIYVPIVRGPLQKEVWTFAKQFAQSMEKIHPHLVTAEYRIAKRPRGRVLVDYNQNAWGRTLASVYSVRPKPNAPVSTPVTWEEIARGFALEDFTINSVPKRLAKKGDLWKPVTLSPHRFDLKKVL
jgi:bifunctional non-homologous end joining protein LigD